jgi:pimeloyl-ACP methyl ester carboxylesterase
VNTALLSIRSTDGTTIGVERLGVGPPLLLVHGTTSTRKRWRAIAEPLARHFTLYLMDRRGRGDSGDGPNYTMAQEFSDVAAVADTIGAPLDVVAHSFGAACSLEAAMRTPSIKRLVIYEPPIPTVGVSASSDESGADKLDELLAANRPAEVLIHFYRHIIGVPEARISRMIESPEWSERLALAGTVPRELRATRRYDLNIAKARALSIPILVMVGADSPPRYQSSTRLLQNTLPNARTVSLPNEQHNAIDTSPELFLREVLHFLAPDARTS